MVVGVRNDGGLGDACLVVPTRDGEADAINADRTFQNDVAREVFRDAHTVPPVFAFRGEMRYLANRVHVTENKVAAKFLARGERPFEIDARAHAKAAIA